MGPLEAIFLTLDCELAGNIQRHRRSVPRHRHTRLPGESVDPGPSLGYHNDVVDMGVGPDNVLRSNRFPAQKRLVFAASLEQASGAGIHL